MHTTVIVKEWKHPRLVKESINNHFEIHAYRGGRGWMPENTIAACIESIRKGATNLHIDVLMCADGELVAAQDALLSARHYIHAEAAPFTLHENAVYNIYQMNYEQVMQFECGLKKQHGFPDQQLVKSSIPLLRQLIDRVEKFVIWNRRRPVHYNFEIQSFAGGDDLFHPKPELFVLALYDLMRQKAIVNRSLIQSSDVRVLKVIRRIEPEIKISFSTTEYSWELEHTMLKELKPDYVSPDFRIVNRSLVELLHSRNIKIIPRVVNEILDINEMKQLGTDGVLTDYPDRAVMILR